MLQYPVYFAFEHQGLAKVLAGIRRNDAPDQPVATNGLVCIKYAFLLSFNHVILQPETSKNFTLSLLCSNLLLLLSYL